MKSKPIKSQSGIKQSARAVEHTTLKDGNKTVLKGKEVNGSNSLSKPTPILSIKQKCECNCHRDKFKHYVCGSCKCKGTEQQEIKIYDLRDFEKEVAGMSRYGLRDGFPRHKVIEIPFKDYEIKKVSGIIDEELMNKKSDVNNCKR